MSMGFKQSAVAPGSHYRSWDIASRRRYNSAQGAPRPSWDVPPEGIPHPASVQPQVSSSANADSMSYTVPQPVNAGSGAGMGDVSNVAQAYRNSAMQDAAARASGARLSAMDASPNDPSLSAYAGLQGELAGQSQASHDVNGFNAQLLDQQLQHEWQKQLMDYEAELERKAHANDWLGELGGVVGKVGGAWLSPGGPLAGKGKGA